jgi:HAD superfamily hydrolase (TIGR01509 family)
MRDGIRALAGAVELIGQGRQRGLPMAICSGALRTEIELASTTVGVRDAFEVIVAAEDVQHGKPDPEGYLQALKKLGKRSGQVLEPGQCVVCEDSPAGIAAAKAAGMRVCAVATSHDAEALGQADLITADLSEVDLGRLADLTSAPQ